MPGCAREAAWPSLAQPAAEPQQQPKLCATSAGRGWGRSGPRPAPSPNIRRGSRRAHPPRGVFEAVFWTHHVLVLCRETFLGRSRQGTSAANAELRAQNQTEAASRSHVGMLSLVLPRPHVWYFRVASLATGKDYCPHRTREQQRERRLSLKAQQGDTSAGRRWSAGPCLGTLVKCQLGPFVPQVSDLR